MAREWYVMNPKGREGPFTSAEAAHAVADPQGFAVKIHDDAALIDCKECKGSGKVPRDYRGDADCA
jgi:hypothetical protein